ncbi:MAG: methyltransferase domain-containing protein [Chloroflexi bacterium]|nr:class I SAM-dependent methyltransferase [Anaerolineaceae bacterium]NMB89101.1 methyltransferase domain-containing protein [Chloroflexota bacterium]
MDDSKVQDQVRQFYDRVGWQMVAGGVYQNARYEDLRPVSHEYIHRCHLRVNRHIQPNGRFLLDAGSGPVQYPEYLTYSQGYHKRVCLDISSVALQEARQRLGDHGLYVVADVANLPFAADVFDGIVSLHTLHHLPAGQQKMGYFELYRVLGRQRQAVVVNGWTDSPLMRLASGPVRWMEALGKRLARRKAAQAEPAPAAREAPRVAKPTGTYIQKLDARLLQEQIGGSIAYEIFVWRSVNVRFLRAMIHAPLAGKFWLRLLYWLEERFPHYFGKQGQYPLVVLRKP